MKEPRMLTLLRRKKELRSVTVSYRKQSASIVTSRVGYGATYAEALQDADRQLPDGTWKRLVVSNTASIRLNLDSSRTARFARSTLRIGENKVIQVERTVNIVTEVDDDAA